MLKNFGTFGYSGTVITTKPIVRRPTIEITTVLGKAFNEELGTTVYKRQGFKVKLAAPDVVAGLSRVAVHRKAAARYKVEIELAVVPVVEEFKASRNDRQKEYLKENAAIRKVVDEANSL